jgi:(p)ppGpp synthase/HD superfamily hydrolase
MMANIGPGENQTADKPLHLSDRFTHAVDYARTLHIERRKGTGIPYMAHLLGVAALVMGEAGHVPVTEDMVIAAILHDAAEDHGGQQRLDDIEHNFGANVARMVEGLSDSLAEDPNKKAGWEDRKKQYVTRLRGEPADVQLISAADKLYNARAILDDYRVVGPEVWARFKRGRDAQIWYFRELLKVFAKSGTNRIVEELERVTNELDRISAGEKGKG